MGRIQINDDEPINTMVKTIALIEIKSYLKLSWGVSTKFRLPSRDLHNKTKNKGRSVWCDLDFLTDNHEVSSWPTKQRPGGTPYIYGETLSNTKRWWWVRHRGGAFPCKTLYSSSPPPGTKTVKLTLQSLIAIVESKEPEHKSFRCPSVAVVRQLTPRGSWQWRRSRHVLF